MSNRAIRSSPSPNPRISILEPMRSTRMTKRIDDCSCAYTKQCEDRDRFQVLGRRGKRERHSDSSEAGLSSEKPSSRKPSDTKQAWVKRAMASREELRSEVVSSLGCVGRAAAMPSRMEAGVNGAAIVVVRVVC